MLVYSTEVAPVPCRTAVVPACDRVCDNPSADIEALATFQIKLRDKLDFTVDFTEWLAANGNATLTSVTFAAASDSPKAPNLVGQASGATKALVVLTPANGDTVGDAYYLDVTAQVTAVTPPLGTADLAIPARQLVRRINIVVVNG